MLVTTTAVAVARLTLVFDRPIAQAPRPGSAVKQHLLFFVSVLATFVPIAGLLKSRHGRDPRPRRSRANIAHGPVVGGLTLGGERGIILLAPDEIDLDRHRGSRSFIPSLSPRSRRRIGPSRIVDSRQQQLPEDRRTPYWGFTEPHALASMRQHCIQHPDIILVGALLQAQGRSRLCPHQTVPHARAGSSSGSTFSTSHSAAARRGSQASDDESARISTPRRPRGCRCSLADRPDAHCLRARGRRVFGTRRPPSPALIIICASMLSPAVGTSTWSDHGREDDLGLAGDRGLAVDLSLDILLVRDLGLVVAIGRAPATS